MYVCIAVLRRAEPPASCIVMSPVSPAAIAIIYHFRESTMIVLRCKEPHLATVQGPRRLFPCDKVFHRR